MLLSVLITALASRQWQKIYTELLKQSQPYPQLVEVLYDLDNGVLPSGVKRQRLRYKARGEYVSYVDDDDLVSPIYIKSLVAACMEKPDVVSFNVRVVGRDSREDVKVETWVLGPWGNRREMSKMTQNHLCAWRKELAVMVSWCPELGYADDQLWYQPMLHSGIAQNRIHINEILYYYIFNAEESSNQAPGRPKVALEYVGDGLKCFWKQNCKGPREIVIEAGGSLRKSKDRSIMVRNCNNDHYLVSTDQLTLFHTIKIA